MHKLRILHVVPSLVSSGMENMATNLACALAKDQFESQFVSLYDPDDSTLADQLAESEVPLHSLAKRNGPDVRMFHRFGRVLSAFRPHVLQTHGYVLRYTLPAMLMYKPNVCVHTVHNLARREVDRIGTWIHRCSFGRTVTPIAVANEVGRSLEALYGLQSQITIPNGIPIDRFRVSRQDGGEVRTAAGLSYDDIVFLTVARMTEQKDPETLLRAFAAGPGQLKKARLLCAGDGELRKDMEQLAASLGISDKVRFLGMRHDVPRLLAAANVFVLTSRWEGHPLAVMEAMASGLPVLATDVGGVAEVVSHGVTGILVKAGDIGAMAKSMVDIAIDHPKRQRFGEASRSAAVRRFSLSAMTLSYQDLYLRLWSNPGTPQAQSN